MASSQRRPIFEQNENFYVGLCNLKCGSLPNGWQDCAWMNKFSLFVFGIIKTFGTQNCTRTPVGL